MELPTFAVSSREFPVPTKMDPIFMFWVSRFEVLSVALAMSRLPTGVPIGILYLLFGEVFLNGIKSRF